MRVFDFAVNGGAGASVICLQQAVNSLLAAGATQLKEDGGWGPMTLSAANAADPTALVSAFQAKRAAYYQTIVADNPAKAIYLSGWINRANA
jgi:lysozyme family protein